MTFHETRCCALGYITARNQTPLQDLRNEISRLKQSFDYGEGPSNIYAIVRPYEKKLKANLLSLGFKRIFSFSRRRQLAAEQAEDLGFYLLRFSLNPSAQRAKRKREEGLV